MKSKTYIVAVSGGVDSVVLLDMLVRASDAQLIVAHFDHGIREDSFEDAVFVQELARKYDFPFELGQAKLGSGASEEAGRKARYTFLHKLAKQHQARIVTAHHADDVLETIIINIIRGTGWRGLASLRNTPEIARPLLQYRKVQLVKYAKEHQLTWREDVTNRETTYLRNKIRHKIMPQLGERAEDCLLELYQQQVQTRQAFEQQAGELLQTIRQADGAYRRYEFIMYEPDIAKELLYEVLRHETGRGTIKTRLENALLAIKTAREGTQYQIGDGITMRFTKNTFKIELEG